MSGHVRTARSRATAFDQQLSIPELFGPPANPLAVLRQIAGDDVATKTMIGRATGTFYTPRPIAVQLASSVLPEVSRDLETIRVCDPFAGDGRLVVWLIEHALTEGYDVDWKVALWDVHAEGLAAATEAFAALEASGARIELETWVGDAFSRAAIGRDQFDVVVTNPPWENLKPDTRDLALLPAAMRAEYRDALKATARHLEEVYPHSAATVKYGGWGANLARIGAEASLRCVVEGGVLGIVLPVSVLADQASEGLREFVLFHNRLANVGYFPAEARPFAKADVGACTLTVLRSESEDREPDVRVFDRSMKLAESGRLRLNNEKLRLDGHLLPVGFGLEAARLSYEFSDFQRFGDLESQLPDGLWAGRELDETRIGDFLNDIEGPPFLKGRMIQRYDTVENPTRRVKKPNWSAPPSVEFERIVWRDISRSSQQRRIIATIVPPGAVAGNSLGVAHFRDGDARRLRLLLGLMSSLAFELQLRARLATGHVTLASIRKVHLPILDPSEPWAERMLDAVEASLGGDRHAPLRVESAAACAYRLGPDQLRRLVKCFPHLSPAEIRELMNPYQDEA